jgi:hypothetical protein
MYHVSRSRLALVGAVTAVLFVVVVGVAYAVVTTVTVSGKATSAVKFVSQAGRIEVDGQPATDTWVNVPGAAATMTIPSLQKGLLIASFDAFSVCSAPGNGPPACGVRIIVNGQPMNPDDGSDAIMTGNSNGELRSINRSSAVLGAGTYTVQVQVLLNNTAYQGANPLLLTNWSLFVQQSKA